MNSEFGYVRVAAAVPCVVPGAVRRNLESMLELAREAERQSCDVVVFPELSLTAYTCADLFQQAALLDAAVDGLAAFAEQTAETSCVHVVGVPLAQSGQLFNCAAVVQSGKVLGIVPKTFVPGYQEYYEPRWFACADAALHDMMRIGGTSVPFGADLLFRDPQRPSLCFGIEICEDLWAPIPPSSRMALAGAVIVVNPSASNDLVGKAAYRRSLIEQQSARCLGAYVYCSAGVGESTTDLVFGGHALIAENGILLAESQRFEREPALTTADVDVEFLDHERQRNVTYGRAVAHEKARGAQGTPVAPPCREIAFGARPSTESELRRRVDPHPFIPADESRRLERCREILAIQSTGLATRLEHTGIKDAVLGLSGGLDSTLALLVTREAFVRLDLRSSGIHCLTMPGFGTSERTLGNVKALCRALDVPVEIVNIEASCRQHMHDIGHDGTTNDVAFENVQARERTQVLMDKANMLRALVVGTGDLSELALGWCTYNGDHMAMYSVNAGVPKTLVRYLIEFFAETKAEAKTAAVLRDILDTPISPELLPPDKDGNIAQETEAVIGPYELHDFFLYHGIRCGFAPDKVLLLATVAFKDTYEQAELRKWLEVFCTRFFQQQFKRSCLPDGPKVGTIALSPRGDWRMPSDASPDEWLARL